MSMVSMNARGERRWRSWRGDRHGSGGGWKVVERDLGAGEIFVYL
jgi:hypothetical protein